MKQYLGIGLAIVTGILIGATGVATLHAQTKPPIYLVTEIDIHDPEAYYSREAPSMNRARNTIAPAGGRQVAVGVTNGGGRAKEIVPMMGTPPKRVVIQVWPSMEALNEWYNSADYQASLKVGQQYATFRRYAIEGLDEK
jgi:uncharacterized protein (DUF1330 family)